MGTRLHRGILLWAAGLVATLVAAGAATAAPPTVTTGAATAVGATSASVAGTVNPSGQATTWNVEYGTTTAYGSQTGAQNAGSGTGNVSVSTTLNGLSPGTTHHYRVVAMSAGGTTLGADATFATATAPAVATGTAGNITGTSATLNGTVNPNGRGTTLDFEYGTTTKYGSKTPTQNLGSGTSTENVSASVSSLKPGTLYHFRVVATSDAGTTNGADQTFFTATGAPVVTTSPASSIGANGARLNGTVNPNGQSTSYHFEYGTTTSYGAKTSLQNAGAGSAARNVSTSISGLAGGTTYHYRLVAVNASGTTFGGDQSFTTVGAPLAQTGPVQNIGFSTTTFTGTVNPHGRATTWYFDYGTSTGYGTKTSVGNAGSGTSAVGVSVPVTGLAAGTTYHYRLVASNSAGTTPGADASFTTARPAVTLAAAGFTVVYGHSVRLEGKVSSGQPGETVTLQAAPFGQSAYAPVATLTTGAGGTWLYLAKPAIQTSYQASWSGSTSSAATVGVRPALSLRMLGGGGFSTHAGAARSFAGRMVKLQRRSSSGRWTTLIQQRLNSKSSATFRTNLPQRTSVLRVAMSVNQAGSGYLAGFSRTVEYRR
jgi:hypothetical protein